LTVGTVVSTVPPEGYPCRVADFTASGDFHPAPEILTLTKIRKIFYGCTASRYAPCNTPPSRTQKSPGTFPTVI
jgi:hypothetical protein